MTNFQNDRAIYIHNRYSFIYDRFFEKHISEEGMPDFRECGLSPYIIREYIDKILQHNDKWAFGDDGIDGRVFKWCCYSGWLVCGGIVVFIGSGWGAILGLLLMVGLFYLVCMILKHIKNKERQAINSQLIESYLEEYHKWITQHYPHL